MSVLWRLFLRKGLHQQSPSWAFTVLLSVVKPVEGRPLFTIFLKLVWSQASFTVSVLSVKLACPGIHFWETLGLGVFSPIPWARWYMERDQSLCQRMNLQSRAWNSRSKCSVTLCRIYKDLIKNSFKLNTSFKPVWHSLEYSWWGWGIVNKARISHDPWGREQSLTPCRALPRQRTSSFSENPPLWSGSVPPTRVAARMCNRQVCVIVHNQSKYNCIWSGSTR